MTTSNGRAADSRRSSRSTAQWLLGLLIVLALIASILMVFTDRLSITGSLAVIAALWAAVIGAILVTPMMNLLRIRDMRARGFAAGLAAHGIGTARAFQVSEVAGTFAGIAMVLNAFVTAIFAPLALHLLF